MAQQPSSSDSQQPPDVGRCASCGATLPARAPQGLCPACLLQRGLESHTTGFTADASVPSPSSRWTPPSVEELAARFPELELVRLLGRGGMGAVYQARQKNLDRTVALKVLPPEMGQDAAFAERFTREAQAMAKLHHPHIVSIHEFGNRDGLYYFVMEFVDGLTLRRVLESGHMSSKEAMAIVPQICEALQYAHDQGIVHRDIKPENILLNKQGQVKIADFGLAKLVGQTTSASGPSELAAHDVNSEQSIPGGLKTEHIMGTPAYMAPEQRSNPSEVDHRADIYALGVVFYQMLTGELPSRKQLEPPSRKVQIDVRLDEIVLRALEQKPERRYQQASEVKTQIDTVATSIAQVGEQPQASASVPSTAVSVTAEQRGPRWALQIPVVGLRQGRRVLHWPGICLTAVVVALCAELGVILWNCSVRWSAGYWVGPSNPLMTMLVATFFVSSRIIHGLLTPTEKLPKLDSVPDSHTFFNKLLYPTSRIARVTVIAGLGLAWFLVLIVPSSLLYALAHPQSSAPPSRVLPAAESPESGHYGVSQEAQPVIHATPAQLAEPPRLRFLAWRKRENSSSALKPSMHQTWLPDGHPVTSPDDLAIVSSTRVGEYISDAKGDIGRQPFLLWFSHDLFDGDSHQGVKILTADGQPTPMDERSSASSIAVEPKKKNRTGWLSVVFNCLPLETSPRTVTVQLRYSIGPWQRRMDVSTDHLVSAFLGPGTRLGSIGQDRKGQSFCSIIMDKNQNPSVQYMVEAVLRDGGDKMRPTGFSAETSGIANLQFQFNRPLSDIDHFTIMNRPIRTIDIPNVVLPPLPGTNPAPTTAPARREDAKDVRVPTPAQLAEGPQLRFVAWQDEQTDRSGVYAPQAWRIDGSLADTPGERKLIRDIPATLCDERKLGRPNQPFIHLWFSHPLIDDHSHREVALLGPDLHPLPVREAGTIASSALSPKPVGEDLGWITYTVGPDTTRPLPPAITVRLRYAAEPWTRGGQYKPSFSGVVSLGHGSQLNGIGQNAQGQTFVAVAVDTKSEGDLQFGAEARLRDGRTLSSRGGTSGGSLGSAVRIEQLTFDAALTDVEYFTILTRPIRTIDFPNVVLPPLPVSNAAPTTAPATQPAAASAPRTRLE